MDAQGDHRPAPHRADIQGLRGLAIVLVVVCHAGLALPGGFVGVDVFFVVSGFVIGRLLVGQLDDEGTLSLRDFYARRARRLLPALAVTIVASLAVGIAVLYPQVGQVVPFRTAAAASVFAANGYLYRHLGYFDATADATNPFLHLWSLAVEEQFYLVLPLLLLATWRLRRGLDPARCRVVSAGVVGILSAASLVLSEVLASGGGQGVLEAPARFAFLSSPTRFWELGVGVLLSLAAHRLDRVPAGAATVLGVAGGVLVVGAAVRTDPLQPFPGLAAVAPVAGAALLLVAGASSPWARRALSPRPLTWLGDRSYSWYLWHWPAIVYAHVLWRGSTLAPVVAAAASLGLAAVTYAAFEDRLRRDRTIVGGRALRLAAVCVVVPLVASLAAVRGAQAGWGVDEPDDWYDLPVGRQVGCAIFNREMVADWPEAACTFDPPEGPIAGTVLVLGDLHADSTSTAVVDAAAERGLQVAQWTRAACPFTGAAPYGYPACEDWQRDALALVDRLEPDLVVVANQSPSYTTDPPETAGSNPGRILRPDGARSDDADQAVVAWEAALRTTLGDLADRGVPAIVVGGVPDHRDDFPRPSLVRPDAQPPVRSRDEVDRVHDPVIAAERAAVAAAAAAAYVDPIPLLCDEVACPAAVDGRWRYSSGALLNNRGSRLLVSSIAEAMDELLPTGG